MTPDEAMTWADRFAESLTPTTSTVTAMTLAAEVRRLQAEAERLPARRAQPTVKTAPIAPTNWPAWGMIDETDEEFADGAGQKVTESAP